MYINSLTIASKKIFYFHLKLILCLKKFNKTHTTNPLYQRFFCLHFLNKKIKYKYMSGFDDQQIEFLYLLAYLYMQQSKYDLALQLFRILRLHTPENLKIALALASCLSKSKRSDEALKVLKSIDEQTLSLEERVAYFYINSKVLWDLKEIEASRKTLHKYLKIRQLKQ